MADGKLPGCRCHAAGGRDDARFNENECDRTDGGRPGLEQPGSCGAGSLATHRDARAVRELQRAPRSPYFGDTHVHTAYSVDAVHLRRARHGAGRLSLRAGPGDRPRAVRRAGQPGRAPSSCGGRSTSRRSPTTRRDSARSYICLTPGQPGYDAPAVPAAARGPSTAADRRLTHQSVLSSPQRPPDRAGRAPQPHPLAAVRTRRCPTASTAPSLVWQRHPGCGRGVLRPHGGLHVHDLRRLRVERSRPLGSNLHRNVIFRNDVVPALPMSYHRADRRRRACGRRSRPQCLDGAARLRRARHPAQLERERRRDACSARERRRQPAHRRRRRAPRGDGAAGRDLPAQGRLRVPARRRHDRRAVRLRESEPNSQLQLGPADPNQVLRAARASCATRSRTASSRSSASA